MLVWLRRPKAPGVVRYYVSAFRLVDSCSSIKRVVELIIYILSDQHKHAQTQTCATTTPSSHSRITTPTSHLSASYVATVSKSNGKSGYLYANIRAKDGVGYSRVNKVGQVGGEEYNSIRRV